MNWRKVGVAIGSVLAILLPVLAHSVYADNPIIHVVLESAAAILGTFGFTFAKPLFDRKDSPKETT